MSNMLVGWLQEPVILNQAGPARWGYAWRQSSNHSLLLPKLSHSSAPPFNVIWAIFQVEPLSPQLSTPLSTNR